MWSSSYTVTREKTEDEAALPDGVCSRNWLRWCRCVVCFKIQVFKVTLQPQQSLTSPDMTVMNEWMNEWCIYIALLCIVVHPKRFTIMWGGGSLLNHHQCAASTWMIRRLPQDNSASALTTHQLQVERRESHRDNQVYALTTHQLQVERRESHRANQVYALTTHTSYRWRGGRVIETIKCMRSPHQLGWRGERVIEPIKCMRSPHTSYRWRGERVIETIKCMLSPHTSYRWRGERVIETIKCMGSPHTSYRWRGERVIEANQVYGLTTHQLQVERRESHRANQVYGLTTHQLQVESRRVIETSSVCSHHTAATCGEERES